MTKLILATSALLLLNVIRGQPAAPTFEVTSVRVDQRPHGPPQIGQPPRRHRFGCSEGERFESIGNLLIRPIAWAYSVRGFQVKGIPRWAQYGSQDAFFDIQAVTEVPVTLEQCRFMVQALLADRFKLVVHRETEDLPVYALVVGKNG